MRSSRQRSSGTWPPKGCTRRANPKIRWCADHNRLFQTIPTGTLPHTAAARAALRDYLEEPAAAKVPLDALIAKAHDLRERPPGRGAFSADGAAAVYDAQWRSVQ